MSFRKDLLLSKKVSCAAQLIRQMTDRWPVNGSSMGGVGQDFVYYNPQKFLDGVYKMLTSIGVTSTEKVELASYKLRDISQVWYTQRKDNRPIKSVSLEWVDFKEASLERYFPR